MKIKMKKCGKMSLIFEFSVSKLGHTELFMKIWEKSFFSKFLPEKDILGQSCRKGLIMPHNTKLAFRSFKKGSEEEQLIQM